MARMQAGLQLKNQLTSKDPNIKIQFQQRWLQIPEEVRTVVKMNVSLTVDSMDVLWYRMELRLIL